VPFDKFKTCGTKGETLKISIFNPGGGIHNATPISAVDEPEGMTQLMQSGFFHSRKQNLGVGWLVVKLRIKPMQ